VRPTVGLVLIRVVTGFVLAVQGWSWVRKGGFDGPVVRRAVDAALDDVGGIAAFWAEHALLYNPDAFAFLGRWLALIAGVCIVLGALTRPAATLAAIGLFHTWVYGPAEQGLFSFVLLVSCAACAISQAGQRLGMDAGLDGKLPSWLTWTPSSHSFLR
jgi:uncharacterized membrane protein YphA (DoxX/SURF4 family)